jgi:hypothetical protein
MATHLGDSTTNAEGTHRGHQACQAVPRPLDSLPAHTGVERKLPRSHGLQGYYPCSTACTSPPSKVYTRCIVSAVHVHIRCSRAPPYACAATVVGPSLPDPATASLGPVALRREEGGGRGSSRGPSASQAAHVASHAPPVAPPPPTRCHRVRSSHQPPLDLEGRQGKREQPRPNGLLGCPHTLHPPRRLHHPAATEGDRRADQPLQPKGETEEGGAVEAHRGPPRLLSHLPRHHRHPTCSRQASARKCPPLPSLAAKPSDPASLRRPPAGSSLLTLPGAASPPRHTSPPKRTSPNRIYRPAARPTSSDLRPAAQHKKTCPRTLARVPHHKRRGEPHHHLPCSPHGL